MASPAFIRKTALALPDVSEHDYHGVKFTIGRKGFIHYWAPDELWFFKLPRPRQEFLFEVRPDVFRKFQSGVILWSIVEIGALSPAEMRLLVIESWSTVALKKISNPYLAAHAPTLLPQKGGVL